MKDEKTASRWAQKKEALGDKIGGGGGKDVVVVSERERAISSPLLDGKGEQ